MKATIKILFLLFISLTQSCTKCGKCFTPPAPFVFNVVNKTTGENLFKNGTYNPKNIEVVNLADSSRIEFAFISEDERDWIQITTIGWKTETVHYVINVSNRNLFDLYVEAERLNDHCCSYTKYDKILIENAKYTSDTSTGVYNILIDTTRQVINPVQSSGGAWHRP